MADLAQLLAQRAANPIQVTDGRPLFSVPLQTERDSLIRDDRQDKRQSPVTPWFTPPPNSTPSLLRMRRMLPSTAIAYQPMSKGEMITRLIQKQLGEPQPQGGALTNPSMIATERDPRGWGFK